MSDAAVQQNEAADKALRRFWLVADDYGISPGVNEAIRDLVRKGRLNATSVIVVAPSFNAAEADALAALDGDGERVAIGLHLTLTAPFRPLIGISPLGGDGAFPTLWRLMAAAFLRRLDRDRLAAELAAQFAKFCQAFGRPPAFVDGHQHVHLLPQVRAAVVAAARESAPRAWIRQCRMPTPWHWSAIAAKAILIDLLSRGLVRKAAGHGLATNPAFAGAYRFRAEADFAALFPHFLAGMPEGGVVMCHPGHVDAELRRVDPLTDLREAEYRYFASDAFVDKLAEHRLSLR